MKGKLLARVMGGDCLPVSKRCRLESVARDGSKQALSPGPALKKTIIIMRSIRSYGDHLLSIVNDDTAAKVEASVNATLGRVAALTDTITKLGGVGVASPIDLKPFVTPVGQAVNWVIGHYLAKLKLDALKRATQDSKTVVANAAALLTKIGGIASSGPKVTFANLVSTRTDAFRTHRTQSNLGALIKAAENYDAYLIAKPDDIFTKLGTAHGALVDHLQNNEISLASVSKQIAAFASEAKTLADILKKFSEASKQLKEG